MDFANEGDLKDRFHVITREFDRRAEKRLKRFGLR